MKALLFALIVAVSLCFSPGGHALPKDDEVISLAEAVSVFNKRSLSDSIGANQPPVSEEEVIAAILLWERPSDAPISNQLLGTFKKIAESKALPSNASFESLNGYDRGGSHIFDVWSVRIRVEREDGSSYAFPIRERVVGSRTLSEEVARLDRFIEEEDVKSWVGGYRILERKKELEDRIKENAQ